MSTGWVIIIVVLVLGVVLGNIMLLRYSAKFKIPKGYKPPQQESSSKQESPEQQQRSHPEDNDKPI